MQGLIIVSLSSYRQEVKKAGSASQQVVTNTEMRMWEVMLLLSQTETLKTKVTFNCMLGAKFKSFVWKRRLLEM